MSETTDGWPRPPEALSLIVGSVPDAASITVTQIMIEVLRRRTVDVHDVGVVDQMGDALPVRWTPSSLTRTTSASFASCPRRRSTKRRWNVGMPTNGASSGWAGPGSRTRSDSSRYQAMGTRAKSRRSPKRHSGSRTTRDVSSPTCPRMFSKTQHTSLRSTRGTTRRPALRFGHGRMGQLAGRRWQRRGAVRPAVGKRSTDRSASIGLPLGCWRVRRVLHVSSSSAGDLCSGTRVSRRRRQLSPRPRQGHHRRSDPAGHWNRSRSTQSGSVRCQSRGQ